MNDYTYNAMVHDGSLTRLVDNKAGYLWQAEFKGTLFAVPSELAELPAGFALQGSALVEDVMATARPILAIDWRIYSSGYRLPDTLADLQPQLNRSSIRLNGLDASDSPKFKELCDQVDAFPPEALVAILKELPRMR